MSGPDGWGSQRIWSLLDVINFMIPHYMAMLQMAGQEIAIANTSIAAGQVELRTRDKERIKQNFQFSSTKAAEYGLSNVSARIDRIYDAIRLDQLTYQEVRRHMQSLIEAYEDDTKFLYLYVYPRDKVQVSLKFRHEWETALNVLPDLADEIDKATDAYALGHNTACVFHLMRVMETGVQRLGKKLGVSATHLSKSGKLLDSTWGDILNHIDPKLNALPADTPAKKARREQLKAVQAHLHAVKEAWRNPTMHPRRKGYNDQETLDIINHVRSFMNELASAISKR